jgi:hypothetical protein
MLRESSRRGAPFARLMPQASDANNAINYVRAGADCDWNFAVPAAAPAPSRTHLSRETRVPTPMKNRYRTC